MSEVSLDAIEEFEAILDAKSGSAADAHGSGRVTRVDADGTAWVHVFGGAGETPLRAYGSALAPGDVVEVRQAANGLYSAGNYSDPAAGVQYVRAVEGIARDAGASAASAVEGAAAARQVADEAQKVAEATNQHFFADDNGAHITDVTQDEWSAAVDDNFSDYDPDSKPYHNQLLNSLGILLRTALNNLVSITRSAIAFYDGAGNAAGNIVARFGADGAQVGMTDESHMELDYHSLQLVDREGETYFHVSDLRNDGAYIVDEWVTTASTISFPLTSVANGTDYFVSVDGVEVASGVTKTITSVIFQTYIPAGKTVLARYMPAYDPKAYTFGKRSTTDNRIGAFSIAEGYNNTAVGYCAHAEGSGNHAAGEYSHAEGYLCVANGLRCGHAEGRETTASASYAHAEGLNSTASGNASHAEGSNTTASGDYSHAQNRSTKASSDNQTVIGKYNVEDTTGDYALIIGNGTGNKARSNALAVTWDGSTIAQAWAGIIQMFAGSTPPNGWLICDGSAVSRTTYAVLFAAIGTTWGAGDGSTTFNLPDLRGRAPIGAGTGSGLTARTLGGTVGEETHTLTIDEMPNHGHKSHYYSAGGRSGDGMQFGSKYATSQDTESGSMIARTGGDGAHNNMQPSAVVNFIIHTGKTS